MRIGDVALFTPGPMSAPVNAHDASAYASTSAARSAPLGARVASVHQGCIHEGPHRPRGSSNARKSIRTQAKPPVSSMTYGKAALCRLLTLVVAVVVYGVVCVRIGRGDAAVAPRFRQYRAGWLPFSLYARWAWAQRRLFISALAKTSCLSGGFKSQLRKERKESHMQ